MTNLNLLLKALRLLVTLAAAALVLIFVLGLVAPMVAGTAGEHLDNIVMLWSSVPFYALALWISRRIFEPYVGRESDLIGRAAPLRLVGLLVILGAATDVIFAPLGLRLVLGQGHGAFLHIVPSAIVLGFAGAALVHVASLAARSDALQHELDQFL